MSDILDPITGANEWQEVHDLPEGAVLVDGRGVAYQVRRGPRWNGETWLCPVSDEYAFIVRREANPMIGDKVGMYLPEGDALTLVWQPS